MEKIVFSNSTFPGFTDGEDILVDTGVLLAYLNDYDSWNNVVKTLFNNYILQEDNDSFLFLYINPCILNEIMHLTSNNQSIITYMRKHKEIQLPHDKIKTIENNTVGAIRILIETNILIPLEATKETYLRQINTYKELGSADSFNVSLANDYGISILTVDNKLVQNIEANIYNFPNISKVYYAPPYMQTY